jgi:hypothetical protein
MLLKRQIEAGELVVECENAIAELAASVLDQCVEMDRKGPRLQGGSKVQFGWSTLTLRAEYGSLRVCEPDFHGDISKLQPNIDTTLAVLKEQVSILHTIGGEGQDITFRDWVAVAKGALQCRDVFLKRDTPLSAADSGWFIGRLEDLEAATSAEVEPMHVYEILRSRSALVNLMTLRPGYLVICHGGGVKAILDENLRVRWGAYP